MNKLLSAILGIILIIPVIVSGCTTVEAYTDPGTAVNAKLNQEFTIALGSNASTGYSWQPTFNPTYLSLVKSEYKNGENANGKIVGAASVEYITFKALNTGDTQVTFSYKRPWEPATPRDKQQAFTINVK